MSLCASIAYYIIGLDLARKTFEYSRQIRLLIMKTNYTSVPFDDINSDSLDEEEFSTGHKFHKLILSVRLLFR